MWYIRGVNTDKQYKLCGTERHSQCINVHAVHCTEYGTTAIVQIVCFKPPLDNTQQVPPHFHIYNLPSELEYVD